MATRAFHRLRKSLPGAQITVAMRPYLRDLLSGSTDFDAVLEAPKAGGIRGLRQQIRAVREGRFDLAVVFPNSLETGLVPKLAGIPIRLGYRQGRPGLMTLGPRAVPGRRGLLAMLRRRGPRRIPEPMPRYYERLLDCLELPPEADLHPRLVVVPVDREFVEAWLRERGLHDQPLALFTAGASFGASKLWMPERFAEVAKHMQATRGMASIILAGPAEVNLARDIAAAGSVTAAVDPVLTLGQLKALVARASLMVTGDTGPRHIAVAFDIPTVVLMGPNDPRYTDYCMDDTVLIRKTLPCSPCQRKICPLGHHDCMRLITTEEVISAATGAAASAVQDS